MKRGALSYLWYIQKPVAVRGKDGLKVKWSQHLVWPVFWHEYGNRYPIADANRHRLGGLDTRCFYCMLDRKADDLLFDDGGVTIIRNPDAAGV